MPWRAVTNGNSGKRNKLQRGRDMRNHTITGGGGLPLHASEWGDTTKPALMFIHGWSQSYLSWVRQFEADLARTHHVVAIDLRGHGMSGKPLDADAYSDSNLWADDIDAVINTLALKQPVLAGWSYGGLVICDYLRLRGDAAIAGVNFVGAATVLNEAAFGTLIGPGFLDHFANASSPDMATSIEAMKQFLHACFEIEPERSDFETALAYNMLVPPQVRGNLGARELDNTDILAAMTKPVLVTHGRADRVVLPAAGEYIRTHCPTATLSWYDGIGHAPFLEDAPRYNRELAAFVEQCRN